MGNLKIAFSGEENTGKTTLSSWLAKELNYVYFPEFARGLLEERELMDPLEWNLWVLDLYKITYSNLKNCGFVADRPISDVYAYIHAVRDAGDPPIFDKLVYQYDALIITKKKLERPEDKKHVVWEKDEEERLRFALSKYQKDIESRGTKVLVLDSDDLEEKKSLILEFINKLN